MQIQLDRRLSFFIVIGIVVLCSVFASCSSYKKVTYFKDVPDSLRSSAGVSSISSYSDPLIQSNDILRITIQTPDAKENAMWSQGSAPDAAGVSVGATGYLVNKSGDVYIPLIGKIRAAGVTTADIRDTIAGKAALYCKDPVVNVRFANFKISVLGEVNHPSQYVVTDEKVSIMDAISMAGDLTIYGKRENVLLIRFENNQKKSIRFDLNNSMLFQSPYFYLRQGDIIYVEPKKSKAASVDVIKLRNISIITSIATILAIVLTRVL